MTETTVTAAEPEREEKPVAELERGTWVELIDQDGDFLGDARVLHVETFERELGYRSILLYQMPGYDPDTLRCAAGMTVPLLTEDEVAVRLEEERRSAIAAQLTALADLVQHTGTPLPPVWRTITVDVDFVGDLDALAGFAKALGVEVRDHGTWLAATRDGGDDHSAGISVMGRASKPKVEPVADPTGFEFSREQGPEDGELTQPGRIEPQNGGMTDGGLVDETGDLDDPHPSL